MELFVIGPLIIKAEFNDFREIGHDFSRNSEIPPTFFCLIFCITHHGGGREVIDYLNNIHHQQTVVI